MQGRTVLLLTGRGMGLIASRALWRVPSSPQPSYSRTWTSWPRKEPGTIRGAMRFCSSLLNEMDGLEDDADVVVHPYDQSA
jgi:hypothetical protein